MSEDILLRIVTFFPIFLFSLTVHEVAHALTANWGGDLTATYQNRLTLNPSAHIDIVGTIIFPLLMVTQGWWLFGWAKPVPVDEQKFRDKAWNVVVSMAGPFSNLLLIIFGTFVLVFILRGINVGEAMGLWQTGPNLQRSFQSFILSYISLNWILMLFNMIPIPPLDGSHVLYHFFIRGRGHLYPLWEFFQRFGFIILWLLIFLTDVGTVLINLVSGLSIATYQIVMALSFTA